MSSINVFLYFHGNKHEGPQGIIFEGEKRCIQINHDTSYAMLKQKIQSKLHLPDSQTISSLTCRFLVSSNPIYFSSLQLFDDEDVRLYCSGGIRVAGRGCRHDERLHGRESG